MEFVKFCWKLYQGFAILFGHIYTLRAKIEFNTLALDCNNHTPLAHVMATKCRNLVWDGQNFKNNFQNHS